MKITCHMIMSVDGRLISKYSVVLSTTPPPVSQRFMKPLMQNYPIRPDRRTQNHGRVRR